MSRREYFKEENRIKKIAAVFSIVLVMTVVAFGFVFNLYNKKLRESARNSLLELGSVNSIVPNQISIENVVLEPTSTSQDRGINEVKKEMINEVKKEVVSKHSEEEISNNIVEENDTENVSETETNDGYIAPADGNYEPSFVAPVSGEIIKDYAVDSLVYSKTLDEWTTHYGIDIRADKMSVVVSSEAGTVESIKNDPRYRTYDYNFSS